MLIHECEGLVSFSVRKIWGYFFSNSGWGYFPDWQLPFLWKFAGTLFITVFHIILSIIFPFIMCVKKRNHFNSFNIKLAFSRGTKIFIYTLIQLWNFSGVVLILKHSLFFWIFFSYSDAAEADVKRYERSFKKLSSSHAVSWFLDFFLFLFNVCAIFPPIISTYVKEYILGCWLPLIIHVVAVGIRILLRIYFIISDDG